MHCIIVAFSLERKGKGYRKVWLEVSEHTKEKVKIPRTPTSTGTPDYLNQFFPSVITSREQRENN